MTGAVSAPRYSAEDFETASVRSAAPSYVSDAPSYHSTVQQADSVPAYASRADTSSGSGPQARHQTSTPWPRTMGLPPIPPAPSQGPVSLHNFRIPAWSANNAPAARHYRNVIERRITDGRYPAADAARRSHGATGLSPVSRDSHGQEFRPLEDPDLVGEVAAAQARRERLAREAVDDVLIQEDRQWDGLLAQMKDWDERERSWARVRREVDVGQRKNLLRRLRLGGGRML